jgi:hypothetical protein
MKISLDNYAHSSRYSLDVQQIDLYSHILESTINIFVRFVGFIEQNIKRYKIYSL